MYLVISLLVLRPGYGDLIVSVPDHYLSFYFCLKFGGFHDIAQFAKKIKFPGDR